MIILFFIFLLTLLLFYNFVWKRRNLPPGPTPLPLLGNGLTLKRLAPGYEAFEQWSKQYGPVFTFWIAEDPIIAVTDFDLIKEAFIKNGDAYAGRDFFRKAFELMTGEHGLHGVLKTDGEEWLQLRRFSLKLLRNLGVGRNQMEKKIMLEVESVIDTVNHDIEHGNDQTKEGYNLCPLIDIAVGSIINQLVFGFRFAEDSLQDFYKTKTAIDNQIQSFMHPVASIVIAIPWLRYFPVFSYYFKGVVQRFDQMHAFLIVKFVLQLNAENTKLKLMQQETRMTHTSSMLFCKKSNIAKKLMIVDLKTHILILILYGDFVQICSSLDKETTSNTIRFLILYMMVYPDIQAKMQEELDRVIGDNEGTKRISLADKAKLPYTNAVINETQRFCNLLPLNLIHRTTENVECGGFKIVKGTKIVPLISCVLYDEKIFPQPHKFMPERFIENGQLKKCEELIPFSIGKRQCMGESLARAELFLFTANLFYLYEVHVIDSLNPPSFQKRPGLTVAPVPFRCLIKRREQNIIND